MTRLATILATLILGSTLNAAEPAAMPKYRPLPVTVPQYKPVAPTYKLRVAEPERTEPKNITEMRMDTAPKPSALPS